jgi:hypothetical protein
MWQLYELINLWPSSMSELEYRNVDFCGGRKPWEKLSKQSWERINNKLNSLSTNFFMATRYLFYHYTQFIWCTWADCLSKTHWFSTWLIIKKLICKLILFSAVITDKHNMHQLEYYITFLYLGSWAPQFSRIPWRILLYISINPKAFQESVVQFLLHFRMTPEELIKNLLLPLKNYSKNFYDPQRGVGRGYQVYKKST